MPNFKTLGLTVSESINFKCEIFGSKMTILVILGHFQPKLMSFRSKMDPCIGFLRQARFGSFLAISMTLRYV